MAAGALAIAAVLLVQRVAPESDSISASTVSVHRSEGSHLKPSIAPTRLASDVVGIMREIARHDENVVRDLASMLTPDNSSALRRGSAAILARMGTPASVGALLAQIKAETGDENRNELLAALDALSNPEVAPLLADGLLRVNDPAVVEPLTNVFARLADAPGVLELVTSFHERATERWQQTNLMGVLLRVRSPTAVPALREVMLHDSFPALQAQAALSLGRIGNTESIRALSAALTQSSSVAFTEVVAESLALALGQL